MTGYTCHHCSQVSPIFSPKGMSELIGLNLPILGEIPIDERVCEAGDAGKPIVLTNPSHPISQTFTKIAGEIINKFPV